MVPLRLPPLRERSEDVPDLIRHFLQVVEREGLPSKQLDQAAVERLKRHRWPGNVRELENLARRGSPLCIRKKRLPLPSLMLSLPIPVSCDLTKRSNPPTGLLPRSSGT